MSEDLDLIRDVVELSRTAGKAKQKAMLQLVAEYRQLHLMERDKTLNALQRLRVTDAINIRWRLMRSYIPKQQRMAGLAG